MALLNSYTNQPVYGGTPTQIGVKAISPQDNINTAPPALPSSQASLYPNTGFLGKLGNLWNMGGGQSGLLGNLFNGNNQRINNVGATNPTTQNSLSQTATQAPSTPAPVAAATKPAAVLPDLNKIHQDKVDAINAQLKAAQDALKTAQSSTAPATPTQPGVVPYNTQYGQNNNPTVGSIASSEANIENDPDVQAARKAIVDLKNEFARKGINIQQTSGSLSQGAGEEGLLQGQYLTALDNAQQNLVQVTQNKLQGLNQAGSQVAPLASAPGTSYFNPATGTYNPTLAGTQGGAGGLQGIGNISGQIQVGQDVAQQNAILGSAQTTGQNLQNLITQNNINPANGVFTAANGLIQLGAKYTGNTAYQEFAGQINDFVSKIAPILGGPNGATTDYKTQLAGQILNAWASGQSINDVISYFLAQAKNNIQGYSGGGGAGIGSPTENKSVSAGGYNFIQDAQGNWVAQ